MSELSRKQFLTCAGVGAGAVALAGATSAIAEGSAQQGAGGCTYPDTISWDGDYDVVVMGAGDAGLAAAVNAARSGAAVLLFDVAPEYESGGNSRYCAQIVRIGAEKDEILTYYKCLYGDHPYDEEILETLAEAQVGLVQSVIDDYGADPDMIYYPNPYAEYPEYPGSEGEAYFCVTPATRDAGLYHLLRDNAEAEPGVDIWYEARGTKLIQDPVSKTVVGVELEKDGKTLRIRARNGVVMACGGFENDHDMLCGYLNITECRPCGTLWNRGDGIRMALEVNADLWHMNCYCSYPNYPYCAAVDTSFGEHAMAPLGGRCTANPGFTSGSFIVVGKDGSRFQNETGSARHGRQYLCGEWKIPDCSSNGFIVMDSAQVADLEASDYDFTPGVREALVSADTVEALAEAIGADVEILAHSVEKFNTFVDQGEDYAFGRDPETMRAIEQAPFYALPMVHSMLNTQGGARRNARCEIVDTAGQPIPHLYSAGEFGGLTGRDYEGATNLAECLVFGKIAGQNAAAPKDPLPEMEAEAVESNVMYTAGSGSKEFAAERSYDLAENQAVGTARGIGGQIDVMVTVDDGSIADVQVVYHHETLGIGTPAVEKIPPAIVEANSTAVDVVAGASVTSLAIEEAAADALEQLGFEG